MLKFFNYYLIDNISETILGRFLAKSNRMAEKMLESFDFEKARVSKNDVSIFMDQRPVFLFETCDEIYKSDELLDVSAVLLYHESELKKDDA